MTTRLLSHTWSSLRSEIESLQGECAHWKSTAKSKHDHLKSNQKKLKEAQRSLESSAASRKELADALAETQEKRVCTIDMGVGSWSESSRASAIWHLRI